MRTAKIERNTKETKVSVELNLDGTGDGVVETGIGSNPKEQSGKRSG